MAKRLRIALLIESSRASGRSLLRGIADYARTHGPWSLYHRERVLHEAVPARLKDWGAHGIIARVENLKLIEQLRQLDLPTVDVLGWHDLEGVPAFGNDRRAISRLAADHLLERSFEHFAYCGLPGVRFSQQRQEYFVERLNEAGYEPSVYRGHRPRRPNIDLAATEAKGLLREGLLAAWLESLPKPVGLMACNDIRAQQVLNVCGDHGIAVPRDVAVIGVDNDEVLCELCDPPLSSIALNNHKIGHEAAVMLDRMINGEVPPTDRTRIAPLGVVTRESTGTVAIANADVAAAVRFIRQHACEGISVEDVLEHVLLSPSTLKRRFARYLGHSPMTEILHVRLERVKELLRTTNLPLAKIAELAGFDHVEWMCKLLKNKTGRTPGQYRKESQPRSLT